jgi:hypothetical protein
MNQPKDVSQQRLNSVDDKRARLALQLVPESSNVEDNTVEILFYTGAEVVRYGYLDGEYQRYYLKFDMDSIDDTRINAGGIGLFLDNSWGEHSPNTRGQIGIALAGTRRHIEGRGHAVKFKLEDVSDFPPENDIRRAVTKIHKGELNNFSMGVGWTREIRDVIDEVVHVTGFNWQPCELTAVSYDADPGTTALNSQEGKMPGTTKTVTELDGQQVPGEAGSAPENAADNTAELSAAKKAGSAQEKARVQELTLLCTKFKCEDRLAEFVAQDVTVAAAKDAILEMIEQRQNLSGRPAAALSASNSSIHISVEEDDKQREAMEEALAFRMAPRLMDAPNGNPFVGKSMLSMAATRASRGRVHLPHRYVQGLGIPLVPLAEVAVLIAVFRMISLVLLPQKHQRHTLAPQFPMYVRPVRCNKCAPTARIGRIQTRLKLSVIEFFRQWPRKTRRSHPPKQVAHRRWRHAHRQPNRPVTQPFRMQTHHVPDFPHLDPLPGHCRLLQSF